MSLYGEGRVWSDHDTRHRLRTCEKCSGFRRVSSQVLGWHKGIAALRWLDDVSRCYWTSGRRKNEDICGCLRGTKELNNTPRRKMREAAPRTTERAEAGSGRMPNGKHKVKALKVCSMARQCQQHLEVCGNASSGATPSHQARNGSEDHHFVLASPPSDSDAYSTWEPQMCLFQSLCLTSWLGTMEWNILSKMHFFSLQTY